METNRRWITRNQTFYRTLAALAVPVALQNLITFAVNFADNLMVGALGDAAISGVYLGNQIQTLLQLFSGGVEGAILILAAQYWGKQDVRSIKRIIAIGVHFSLAFGLLLSLICLLFPTRVLRLFTQDPAVIAEGAQYLRIVCLFLSGHILLVSLAVNQEVEGSSPSVPAHQGT